MSRYRFEADTLLRKTWALLTRRFSQSLQMRQVAWIPSIGGSLRQHIMLLKIVGFREVLVSYACGLTRHSGHPHQQVLWFEYLCLHWVLHK